MNMTFHPLIMILFICIHFFMVLFFSNPLFLSIIFIFYCLLGIILNETKNLKKVLKISLYTAIMIIVINPLVSNTGETALLRIVNIPIIGHIRITLEAILFGVFMALKFINMMLLFFIYGILTDKDEVFGFCSKYLSRLTLTVSMTTNIIHRLRIEVTRIKDVMQLRGVKFDHKNIFKRVKAYYPIIKVIFISALEGSLDRAEALYVKKYGEYKRTSYYKLMFFTKDYLMLIQLVILICILIIGAFYKVYIFKFYPKLSLINLRQYIFLGVLFIHFLFYFLIIKGGLNGRFSSKRFDIFLSKHKSS